MNTDEFTCFPIHRASFAAAFAAATLSASAAWFDAGIADYESWPTDGSDLTVAGQGTWTGTTNATLDAQAHALSVATRGEAQLAFAAASPADAASANVVVAATLTFPSVNPATVLPALPAEIKFALSTALGEGGAPAFYGRAKDPDAATNRWVALAGATPPAGTSGTACAVRILSKAGEGEGTLLVQYEVDGVALSAGGETWLPVAASGTTVSHAAFRSPRASRVSALSGDIFATGQVSFTIPALPENVTLVSVTADGVPVEAVGGVYTVPAGSAVVVTFAPAAGYLLEGAPAQALVTPYGNLELPASAVPTAVALSDVIRINEIMASNPSLDKGGIASAKGLTEMDWIELYNGSSQAVDLTGWHLSDNDRAGKEDKATILGSCVIPAGGYKIVWLDKLHLDPAEYAADEAFAALGLSSSGDLIQLATPAKVVVGKVNFKDKAQIKGYSYGPPSVLSGGVAVPGPGPCAYMKTATPGAPNVLEGWGDFTPEVSFSVPHGYKTEAFDLELSCAADPTAAIYYTIDGTSPTTASTRYTGPIAISKTTVVRAAVPVENAVLQVDSSATYIFLDEVVAQARSTTAPASDAYFPNNGDASMNGQSIKYGMDQGVVSADRDRILRGFTNSIATISLVIDPANLFNASTGIYVNAENSGLEWERQTMVEQINPLDESDTFTVPAGLRIRGGWSRKDNHPKHALRLFFRSSYGMGSLEAKVFPGDDTGGKEAGSYDKLDLRCSQNLSWANENSGSETFVHEVFCRDSQGAMGDFHTRSRYYNLFINGQYWGLYQSQERGDEHFAESYAGGDSLDWDVIKSSSEYVNGKVTYAVEANEGTMDGWSNLWEVAVVNRAGLAPDAVYRRALGCDADGTRNAAYPVLLDPTNLIHYALLTHYLVDGDCPVYEGDKIVNNMYALRDRTDGSHYDGKASPFLGFFFLRHDGEFSFARRSGYGNSTPATDPTLWGTGSEWNTLARFSPVKLHFELMKGSAYRTACADEFYRLFLRPEGAMTTERNIARFAKRMAEIDDAIACEAARWGSTSRNRSTWLTACNYCTNTFLAARMPHMLSQYRARGWYPAIDPPTVVDEQGVRYADGGEVPYGGKVALATTVDGGTVYYTTDGASDPMDAGATVYTGAFAIPDSGFTVRARVLKDGEWSALEEVALEADVPNDQRYGVRIAAIRNAAAVDPDEEFIVLTNVLDRAVSLEGLSIWSEKTGNALVKLAELGAGVELPAGGTIRLTQPDHWIEGLKLKNGEIYVELRDFNGKRIQNARVDSGTWFPTDEKDEKGKTICACNKTGRWFVALAFLGDTDGGEVTDVSQWAPSPPPWKKGTLILFK